MYYSCIKQTNHVGTEVSRNFRKSLGYLTSPYACCSTITVPYLKVLHSGPTVVLYAVIGVAQ